MIKLNGKQLLARYIGERAVDAVYHGSRLVWRLGQAAAQTAKAKITVCTPGTMRLGGQDISARYYGKKAVAAIYHGLRLVWPVISSAKLRWWAEKGIAYRGKQMEARYLGEKAIQAVYYGAVLVWEAVSSCFGSGMWINDRPWGNTDAWNNGTN